MKKKNVLICGVTGFIGRNMAEAFLKKPDVELYGTHHRSAPDPDLKRRGLRVLKANLTSAADVEEVIRGKDVVIQAAATTSGAKDIITQPYVHVTDNAVMNSLIFRACHEHKVKRVIFFSCTTMYAEQPRPVKETDFNHQIVDNYFGVGWTKVYIEKMCEFYARLGPTQYAALRHSNIYGPHDKYDLERSHVFGATVAKVMNASQGCVTVWGDGSDERDLLYVDDLVSFVEILLEKQRAPFELINVGSGRSIAVRDLVEKTIRLSGRKLEIEYDRSKPSLNYKLAVDIGRAKTLYGWTPKISLEEGIKRSLAWYKSHHAVTETA